MADKIARIEREAQAAGLSWPNRTPLLCEELAQRVASPLVWAKALNEAETAGDTIAQFLRRAVELEQEGWSRFAASCLTVPRLKLYIVAMVITHKDPPIGLLRLTLQNMDGAANLTNFHCRRNEVSEDTIFHLLRHQNTEIATAAALGVWEAEPRGEVPSALNAVWREAINNSISDDFWLSEVLKGDSSLSFGWLQRRLSATPRGLYRLGKAVDAATDALRTDDRLSILHQLPIEYPTNELVEKLVGDDLKLYREVLNDVRLKPVHLFPLAGETEGVWTDKAILALDAGYSPEDIPNAFYPRAMSLWGEEPSLWVEWIDRFDRLLSHDDKRIQAVGELGKANVEAKRDSALGRERQEAIHGIR